MTETLENPLARRARSCARTPDPCVFVIFGASGDLTQRKLIPALYSLAYRRLLPEKFAVVGVARTAETRRRTSAQRMEAAVREHARDPFRDDVWEALADGMRYVSTEFDDDDGEDQLAKLPGATRRGARHRGQPPRLLRRAAERDRDDRRRARRRAALDAGLDHGS